MSFRWLVLICLLPLGAGCNTEPSWKELKLPADSVGVQMPTQWKVQQAADGQGQVYQAIHGRKEYLLSVHRVPQADQVPAAEARKILRLMRDEFVAKIGGGSVENESETQLDGRPGIEFESKGKEVNSKARLFLTDRAIVSVVVVDYAKASLQQPNIDKFLSSLTFDLTKPGTPTAPAASTTATVPPVPGSPAASNEDKRTAWRYTNAPQIFPDQHGYNGVIRKTTGNNWVDETEKGPLEFLEDYRTPEFVELKRPVGDFRVRLYNDHSEYKFGHSPKWEQMFPGKWE